jgi:hypothetical protein
LQQRLGDRIFGTDDETLEGATIVRIQDAGWRLATLESGTNGDLAEALRPFADTFLGGEVAAEDESGTRTRSGEVGCVRGPGLASSFK